MMRVDQIVPMGRKAGKRLRKSLPKTMGVIQSRVERIGDRLSTLSHSAAANKARKAVRRGTEQTVKWVRKNPKALPIVGLGGALATCLFFWSRRKAQPKLLKGAMGLMGSKAGKGFGSVLGKFLAWALSPRKPHVFRAVSIRW